MDFEEQFGPDLIPYLDMATLAKKFLESECLISLRL